MSERVQFRLELSKSDLEEEKDAANKSGKMKIEKIESIESTSNKKPLQDARFVEVLVLVGVSSVTYLAKRLVDHFLKKKEQGIQIDLQKDPPVISKIAGVPMGFVLIIDKKGKVTTHQAKYEKGEDLMPLLSTILKPSGIND